MIRKKRYYYAVGALSMYSKIHDITIYNKSYKSINEFWKDYDIDNHLFFVEMIIDDLMKNKIFVKHLLKSKNKVIIMPDGTQNNYTRFLMRLRKTIQEKAND